MLHDYDGSYGTSPKYTLYTNETAGATGILFWSLPSSTDTSIWWSGNTNVAAGSTGRMHLYTTASSAPSVLPEAFLFQPGPMTVSTSWGLRVFDGAGQVMFDGATESLKIESRITGVQYNLSTENSYTLPSGFTPAMYFPGYYSETKTGACVDGYAGIRRQRGMMRRNGTSLITLIRIMDSEPDAWDCRRNESVRKYEWGMSTNLFVPVINANRYGGASI